MSVVDFIWRPTRKKPLGGELVELELGLLQLASDTVIYATAYQRWTADGRRATYHVFKSGDRVTMVMQSVQQFISN